MRSIKKCIYVFSVSLLLIVCLSLSAFASDIEFTLTNYPSEFYVNDSQYQSYDYIFRNYEGNYYYCVVRLDVTNNSQGFNGTYYLRPFVVYNVSSVSPSTLDSRYLFPIVYKSTGNFSAYTVYNVTQKVYDTNGNLVFSVGPTNINYGSYGGTPYFIHYLGLLYSNGVRSNFKYMGLFTPTSFYILNDNTVRFDSVSGAYQPSGYYIGMTDDYYNLVTMEQESCSLPDKVYINGVKVFDPDASEEPNLASKIIGSAIGNITLPDGNGGTVSGDVNVSVDLDIPDKEFNNGITYPDMSDINDTINDNMTELDIMDTSTDAFNFIYTKINEFAHANNKILIMFTSCLSAGVIMIILNKRGV